MEENKKVSFSAQDSGLTAFMQKVRDQSKRMFDEQLTGAKKLSGEFRDQLKFMGDYIKQLEVRNRIEREGRRAELEHKMRYGGEKQRDEAFSGLEALKGESRQQGLQTSLLKEMLNEMKASPENTPTKRQSIFNEVLKAGLARDIAEIIGRIPSARTGLEGISGASHLAGTSTGAILGGLFGKSAAGALAGKVGLGFLGDAMVRHLQEQSRFSGTVGRLRGIGANTEDLSVSSLGLDVNTAGALKEAIVRAAGLDPKELLKEVVAEMKAFTLSEGTIGGYMGTRRFGDQLVPINTLSRTLINRGGSKVDIERLISNQTQLVNLLAQSAISPNQRGAAMSLFDFNAINRGEGPFGIHDPRSMQMLSTIHGNIVNPSTPFGQAQNYALLRRLNPGASVVDLMIQQQRGIENRELTRGILDEIVGMGGGEDFQTLMVANRLGLGNNLAAARMLLKGRGKIGGMTEEDFMSFSQQQMMAMGEQNVPRLDKNMALITNSFVDSMSGGIKEVAMAFKEEIKNASKEAMKEIPTVMTDVVTDAASSVWDRIKPYFAPEMFLGKGIRDALGIRKSDTRGK